MDANIALDTVENSQAKPKRAPVVDSRQPIPFLLEFTLSISRVIVVLVAMVVAGLSWLRGADYLNIGLRSGTSLLAVGVILWAVNWAVSNNLIEVTREIQTRPSKNDDGNKPGQETE